MNDMRDRVLFICLLIIAFFLGGAASRWSIKPTPVIIKVEGVERVEKKFDKNFESVIKWHESYSKELARIRKIADTRPIRTPLLPDTEEQK